MTDITMCANEKCPSRDKCYRARAQPCPFRQSWTEFEVPNGQTKCDHFWPIEKGDRLAK